MGQLKLYWNYLRSSLWFIPLLLLLGSIVLAFGLIEVDSHMHRRLVTSWPRLFAAEPQGSQAMLSAIAASMITVAGVVFSITIVALAQASTQYSPRVLRNFMADRRNQVVLGFFVGVFAYCLVILRNITWETSRQSVPSLAVFFAFVLALAAIGFLIYFIHHIASSIQASTMTHSITAETLAVIQELYPHPCSPEAEGQEDNERHLDASMNQRQWHPVPALKYGYVQRVEKERLFRIACQRGITLRMEVGVGEFAHHQRPLLSICGCGPPDSKLIRQLNANYGIDAHRTVDQDPAFGIQQLVDIAVKALSPGINDTTTATTAIDYLSEILRELACRCLDLRHEFGGTELRVIVRGVAFEKLLIDSFEPLLENAEGNQLVMAHLLLCLENLAAVTRGSRRQAVHSQVASMRELVKSLKTEAARGRIQARLDRLAREMHMAENPGDK